MTSEIYKNEWVEISSRGKFLYMKSIYGERLKIQKDDIWNEYTVWNDKWDNKNTYLQYFIDMMLHIGIKY